jgi:hypothetical protein
MKKIYLRPETKWLEPVGSEALMDDDDFQNVSMNVNDGEAEQDVDDFADLLSNESVSVWEEDN